MFAYLLVGAANVVPVIAIAAAAHQQPAGAGDAADPAPGDPATPRARPTKRCVVCTRETPDRKQKYNLTKVKTSLEYTVSIGTDKVLICSLLYNNKNASPLTLITSSFVATITVNFHHPPEEV